MRYVLMAALAALCASAAAQQASAQGLLDAICDAATERGETATETEYRADPGAHSDDFCALARFDAHKAARQLSKSIRIVRRFENRNRYYFDPRRHGSTEYIQLLRPWMADENKRGIARWVVSQRQYHGNNTWNISVYINDESVPEGCERLIDSRIRLRYGRHEYFALSATGLPYRGGGIPDFSRVVEDRFNAGGDAEMKRIVEDSLDDVDLRPTVYCSNE